MLILSSKDCFSVSSKRRHSSNTQKAERKQPGMNSQHQYYYEDQGELKGPFSEDHFVQLAKNGVITAATLCQRDGDVAQPAKVFFGKSWTMLEAFNALNQQESASNAGNPASVSAAANPPPIPQSPSKQNPVTDQSGQSNSDGFQQSFGQSNLGGESLSNEEKKNRLKFRLEMAAAILAIVGSLIAILVYFLPGNAQAKEPQTREEVAAVILKALREGDKDTFEKHLSVEILNSAGDGENLDKLFVAWQKDAKKPGMTAEKLARVATFVRENEKWKLNER